MTDKKWLIRTSSNQIVGPISRGKLLELIDSAAIHKGDEICAGNGFWFMVMEEGLLNKYLKLETPQPFNPIQEAEDVLTKGIGIGDDYTFDNTNPGSIYEPIIKKDSIIQQKSSEDDIRRVTSDIIIKTDPDIDFTKLEITQESNLNKSSNEVAVKVETESGVCYPKETDLEYPEIVAQEIHQDKNGEAEIEFSTDSDIKLELEPMREKASSSTDELNLFDYEGNGENKTKK